MGLILDKIAGWLAGIAIADLTTAERQIYGILKDAGYADEDENGSVTVN